MQQAENIYSSEAVIDNGTFGTRRVRFETGRLARQAAGSVVAVLDDETMLLSATTASRTPKDQFDFFPLTVDVEERMYAVGRIPGSFFRREGRPGEDAILTCRLIDRPLRPSFVKGLRNEVQIVVTVMALNPADLYDVIAINAASASTQIAGLPFSGPIGGVRVALIDGQWVCFPTHDLLERAVFDMVVAGRVVGDDVAIMMVEAEATEQTVELVAGGAVAPTEEVVAQGLEAAKPFIKALCDAQAALAAKAAKPVGEFPVFLDYQSDAYDAVAAAATDDLRQALTIVGKAEREDFRRPHRVIDVAQGHLGERPVQHPAAAVAALGDDVAALAQPGQRPPHQGRVGAEHAGDLLRGHRTLLLVHVEQHVQHARQAAVVSHRRLLETGVTLSRNNRSYMSD